MGVDPIRPNLEMLNTRDILQINATIIVGVLVLMTLTNINLNVLATKNVIPSITFTIIFPFIVSSILAIFASFGVHASFERYYIKVRPILMSLSKWGMVAGFVYMMAWIYLIADVELKG